MCISPSSSRFIEIPDQNMNNSGGHCHWKGHWNPSYKLSTFCATCFPASGLSYDKPAWATWSCSSRWAKLFADGMGGNHNNLKRPHYKCGLVMGTLTKTWLWFWVGEWWLYFRQMEWNLRQIFQNAFWFKTAYLFLFQVILTRQIQRYDCLHPMVV